MHVPCVSVKLPKHIRHARCKHSYRLAYMQAYTWLFSLPVYLGEPC